MRPSCKPPAFLPHLEEANRVTSEIYYIPGESLDEVQVRVEVSAVEFNGRFPRALTSYIYNELNGTQDLIT